MEAVEKNRVDFDEYLFSANHKRHNLAYVAMSHKITDKQSKIHYSRDFNFYIF